MNINDTAALLKIAQQLATNPAIQQLKESSVFKDLEKQLDPMRQEFIKTLAGLSEQEKAQTEVNLDRIIPSYEALFNHHFIHTKTGKVYSLIGISNKASTDQEKFPVTAVYFSLETKEIWSRPLMDFSTKFTLKQ